MSDARAVIVIPTYNECDNVSRIVDRVRESVPEVDVLIVDDGSPDGTGVIADGLAAVDDQVHVLHHRVKAGLGAAYVAGFAWALGHDYRVIVEMDADGSHAPEQLPRLLDELETADVVLGSRWVDGGSVRNWPWSRMVLSRAGNLYTRLALGISVKDATGGFRAFRGDVLTSVGLDDVSSQGYCFQVELVWRAVRAGFAVVEVPISFVERELGESKMSGSIVREALVSVTRWGVRYRWEQVTGRATKAAVLPHREGPARRSSVRSSTAVDDVPVDSCQHGAAFELGPGGPAQPGS